MAEVRAHTGPSGEELARLFVAEAKRLVGAPYRHRGRTREGGLDCFGVIYASAHALGFRVADYEYDWVPGGDFLDEKLADHMVRLPNWEDARPGDVVTRCYRLGEPAKHCGVVTLNEVDNLRCVHASRRRDVRRVVEVRWPDPQFNLSAFRVREIAEAL